MALKFQPHIGTVLMCDFAGSVEPEMVKVRPVVILARNRTNKDLVTIVPLSTTKPLSMQDCHYELPLNPIPGNQTVTCWAKCDMIATVSIARLDRVKIRTAKGRVNRLRFPRHSQAVQNIAFQNRLATVFR
jgi:uncharacterized protein YifN (PemK superfamily)